MQAGTATLQKTTVHISPSCMPLFAARAHARGRELATSVLTFSSLWPSPLESESIQRSVPTMSILGYVACMHRQRGPGRQPVAQYMFHNLERHHQLSLRHYSTTGCSPRCWPCFSNLPTMGKKEKVRHKVIQFPQLIRARPDADHENIVTHTHTHTHTHAAIGPVGFPRPSLRMAISHRPPPPLPLGESPREPAGLLNGCFFSVYRRGRAARCCCRCPFNSTHGMILDRNNSDLCTHTQVRTPTQTHTLNVRSCDYYAAVPLLCLRTCGGVRADPRGLYAGLFGFPRSAEQMQPS